MAWKVDIVGTPAACVTAVQALTSGNNTANEAAQVVRLIPVIVAEINAYPAVAANLHVYVEGGLNFDGDWVKLRVEPVFSLGNQYFTTPIAQTQAP